MKKLIFITMALAMQAMVFAQKNTVDKKYGYGAVPVVEGKVVFSENFKLEGKTKAEIFNKLNAYAGQLAKGGDAMPQCRVTTSDENNGIVAVNMEEWMVFKQTAWVTNRTRFYYQLLFQIAEGGYTATLRNIHYLYDEERNGGLSYSAEEWITDDKALVKKGTKLSKYSGKFRTFTIDRKDQLFNEAYTAAGGKVKKKVKKVVYEEVEE